jgi:hypothetical protein
MTATLRQRLWCSLIAIALTVSATTSIKSQGTGFSIINVSVVDVTSGQVLPRRTVTVDGDKVTTITQTAPPRGATVIDGTGKFLIPGLWDMHAHLQFDKDGALPLNVANGVTGVRDMGADLDFILEKREATATGRIVGPRIIAAGPILDDAPADWPLRMRVKNADEARAAVQLLKNRGVDLIKVHNYTPRDAFFAIADEARRQNLPFAGHVPLKVTIQEAVDAGISSVEHLSEDGRVWKACSEGVEYRPEACRPFFEMLAQRHVWQMPTLLAISEAFGGTMGTPESHVTAEEFGFANKDLRDLWSGNQQLFATKPELLGIVKSQAETAKVVTNDMSKAGVGLLAGCDAMVPGFCVHGELAKMVEGGMTPLAALQTATINPAKYLRLDTTIGTISAGKRADLVILDANPLNAITNTRRINAVVLGGRLLRRTELDKLLAQAKAAAAQ